MVQPDAKADLTEERLVIISSDTHAGADIQDYKPYLERRWHDEFEGWARDYHDPWADLEPPGPDERRNGLASAELDTNWDSAKRLSRLEAEGIAAEVVFPNTAPPFFPSGVITAPNPASREEYDRRLAGVRAHNRWLVEFCAEAPGRRAGVAQIFLNNIDDAVEEIKWAKSSGLAAVLIPYIEPGGVLQPLVSPIYEPVWAACAEADIAMNSHVSAASVGNFFGDGPGMGLVAAVENNYFFAQRPLWHLIFAGVFERYPQLRFTITEITSYWVPQRLRELDYISEQTRIEGTGFRLFCGDAVDGLSLKPSEYFARNCYLGASFMMRFESLMRHEIGVDRLMWGMDFPHSEGTYPYTRETLRATFAGVPENELRMMLGETAAKVYGFDLDALAPVAARIGLLPSDIQEPLPEQERPRFPQETSCLALTAPAFSG
jgi:predicted TIM-barrel fold metal-dependent hydrolase